MNKLGYSLLTMLLAASLLGCSPSGSDRSGSSVEDVGPAPAAEEVSITAFAKWTARNSSELPPSAGTCALDVVNGEPAAGARIRVGNQAVFGGWAADANKEAARDTSLWLIGPDRSYSAPVTMGVLRPDVASALGVPAMGAAGFDLVADMDVEAGDYAVSIAFGSGADSGSCPTSVTLSIIH